MKKDHNIFETLKSLGLTSIETREVFNERTRDKNDLRVWKDRISEVIYIDGFYAGDETYKTSEYRKGTDKSSFEIERDAERRLTSFKQLIAGKVVLDFGCGQGEFLKSASTLAKSVTGVELRTECIQMLRGCGIDCVDNLSDVTNESIDVVTLFHVLEHLPEPKSVLSILLEKMKPGGQIIVEVPHARDLLLTTIPNEAFKQFTLWSHHLVLHTRESLRRTLSDAGFSQIIVEGFQRYPLSNHLNWLQNGRPGGHKSHLSTLDTPRLVEAYEASLTRLDATDTIVAVAEKPKF